LPTARIRAVKAPGGLPDPDGGLRRRRQRPRPAKCRATRTAFLHAVVYLLITAAAALAVFEKLGVGILRKAWFNVDLVWMATLIATGLMTVLLWAMLDATTSTVRFVPIGRLVAQEVGLFQLMSVRK
jgi:hypothetical protein